MRKKLSELLGKVIEENILIPVSVPEEDSYGHYSTNVAFLLSKEWKVSPVEAAQRIKEKIVLEDKGDLFKNIDVVNPGFINFWISNKAFYAEIDEILKKKSSYGKPNLSKSDFNRKTQVEFISANPTGPLTMANGRGGFLGDVLSNILEFSGRKVEREYYVNDTGNQIITLGKSLSASLGIIDDEENFYKGEYIKKWALKHKSFIQNNKATPLLVGQRAAKDFLSDIKKIVQKKARINFDRYTSENGDIHTKGLIDKALTIFKSKDLTYKKEGAIWLKTSGFDDDKDRVLITSDEFPTYFLADCGHLLETIKRGFKEKILILGPDHFGYVARIKAAASILGLSKLEPLVTQAVRIVKDGMEVKMSKRKGEFITFDEVIDEVGMDAARFFFLMHARESHMDFDLKLAKERSMKNPVYYVQYAYVRCRAILQKTKNTPFQVLQNKIWYGKKSISGYRKSVGTYDIQKLNSEAYSKLILKLVRFPEIIEDTAQDFQAHRLARYSTELSYAFHNFYEKERILGEKDGALAIARLELVVATQIILGKVLDILGVSKPKEM